MSSKRLLWLYARLTSAVYLKSARAMYRQPLGLSVYRLASWNVVAELVCQAFDEQSWNIAKCII